MQDDKHRKKAKFSTEDFKNTVDGIVNEIEAIDLASLDLPDDLAEDDDALDGLVPPPENELLSGKDFSDITVGDDELF